MLHRRTEMHQPGCLTFLSATDNTLSSPASCWSHHRVSKTSHADLDSHSLQHDRYASRATVYQVSVIRIGYALPPRLEQFRAVI